MVVGEIWLDASLSVGEVIEQSTGASVVMLRHGAWVYRLMPLQLIGLGHIPGVARDRPAFEVLELFYEHARQPAKDPAPVAQPQHETEIRDQGLFYGGKAKGGSVKGGGMGRAGPGGHARDVTGFGGPPQMPRTLEGTTIVRHPRVALRETPALVAITVDLALAPFAEAALDPIRFADLADDWRDFAVAVHAASPQLAFDESGDSGTILVKRDDLSVACKLLATRAAPDPIELTLSFFRADRWCGTVVRTFTGAEAAPPAEAPLSLPAGARGPDLTITILRNGARLQWLFMPASPHLAHVRRIVGESTLGVDPAAYVRSLFMAAVGAEPGEHAEVMQGIGERIWDATPDAFRDAYWALRKAIGSGFSIQLMVDEPHVPWELMRPVREGEPPQPLLAALHPVARGLVAQPGAMRPTLPTGAIVTVAPDYASTREPLLPALPAAREEAEMLRAEFAAIAADGDARDLIDLLEDKRGAAVSILHFAGHGRPASQIDQSALACADRDVTIYQVRRQETALGERRGTFVILNACDAGAGGDALGQVGGWGEAFAARRFSGFIAPLWAVYDSHAKHAMQQLYRSLLREGRTVGEALRDLRAAFADRSPTFLSYVYYGDVNARF